MTQTARRQVFIGNLAYTATEADVSSTFSALGVQLEKVRVVTDRETGRPRGFAFVDLAPVESRSIEEVIEAVNDAMICGRPIHAGHANNSDRPQGDGKGRHHRPRRESDNWE